MSPYGTRRYPVFTAGKNLVGQAFGSDYDSLHFPGYSITLAMYVDVLALGTLGVIFATRTTTATERGFLLHWKADNSLRLQVSNGTTVTLDLNAGAALTAGPHIIIVNKDATNLYEVFVDGALYASGTSSTLTAGGSAAYPSWGAQGTGVLPFQGAIAEGILCQELSAPQRDVLTRHLALWASPSALGAPSMWFEADGQGNRYNLGASEYLAGVNQGSMGSGWAAFLVGGNNPYLEPFGTEGKKTPAFYYFQAWGAGYSQPDGKVLHDDSDQTISFRIDYAGVNGNVNLFADTMTGLGTDIGFHCKAYPDGRLYVDIGNGVSLTSMFSAPSLMTAGPHTIQLTKTAGGVWNNYLDGVLVSSGTVPTPSPLQPMHTVYVGNYQASFALFANARIAAFIVTPGVFNAAKLYAQRQYLESKWR